MGDVGYCMVINAERTAAGDLHNHLPPSEWKLSPKMICDIADATKRNMQRTPKEKQKCTGQTYSGSIGWVERWKNISCCEKG